MQYDNGWKTLTDNPGFSRFDVLGFLPDIISQKDQRPIKEQVSSNYVHGGGWKPFGKDKWKLNPQNKNLKYPGDPKLCAIAELQIRDELFILYEMGICCVRYKDGSFDVLRMD